MVPRARAVSLTNLSSLGLSQAPHLSNPRSTSINSTRAALRISSCFFLILGWVDAGGTLLVCVCLRVCEFARVCVTLAVCVYACVRACECYTRKTMTATQCAHRMLRSRPDPEHLSTQQPSCLLIKQFDISRISVPAYIGYFYPVPGISVTVPCWVL